MINIISSQCTALWTPRDRTRLSLRCVQAFHSSFCFVIAQLLHFTFLFSVIFHLVELIILNKYTLVSFPNVDTNSVCVTIFNHFHRRLRERFVTSLFKIKDSLRELYTRYSHTPFLFSLMLRSLKYSAGH